MLYKKNKVWIFFFFFFTLMDKRKSSSITTSSPRDIPVRVIDDEIIPSRSYYSSHLHVEPGKLSFLPLF